MTIKNAGGIEETWDHEGMSMTWDSEINFTLKA